jgi:hypothetical protein
MNYCFSSLQYLEDLQENHRLELAKRSEEFLHEQQICLATNSTENPPVSGTMYFFNNLRSGPLRPMII